MQKDKSKLSYRIQGSQVQLTEPLLPSLDEPWSDHFTAAGPANDPPPLKMTKACVQDADLLPTAVGRQVYNPDEQSGTETMHVHARHPAQCDGSGSTAIHLTSSLHTPEEEVGEAGEEAAVGVVAGCKLHNSRSRSRRTAPLRALLLPRERLYQGSQAPRPAVQCASASAANIEATNEEGVQKSATRGPAPREQAADAPA